jgi:hypothetical protein
MSKNLVCVDPKLSSKTLTKITKHLSTQIVKSAVAPDLLYDVVQKCRSQPFTIMCDESNDYGNVHPKEYVDIPKTGPTELVHWLPQ